MKYLGKVSLLILILLGASTLHASLDWSLCPDDLQPGEPIANYYSGGYGGFGTGPGPDIGVSFSGQFITVHGVGPCGTWEDHGFGKVAGDSTMNMLDGATIISFYARYSNNHVTTMSLFTGFDGTGDLLAQQIFDPNEQFESWCDPRVDWCDVAFLLPEVAHSVVFTGDGLVLATLTSGGVVVPEPGTCLLLGTAILGVAEKLRRNRRRP